MACDAATTRSTALKRIVAARSVLDTLVEGGVKQPSNTDEFIKRLSTGDYLLRVVRGIAKKLNLPVEEALTPIGTPCAQQKNIGQ